MIGMRRPYANFCLVEEAGLDQMMDAPGNRM
jgi:hypothetical protein